MWSKLLSFTLLILCYIHFILQVDIAILIVKAMDNTVGYFHNNSGLKHHSYALFCQIDGVIFMKFCNCVYKSMKRSCQQNDLGSSSSFNIYSMKTSDSKNRSGFSILCEEVKSAVFESRMQSLLVTDWNFSVQLIQSINATGSKVFSNQFGWSYGHVRFLFCQFER